MTPLGDEPRAATGVTARAHNDDRAIDLRWLRELLCATRISLVVRFVLVVAFACMTPVTAEDSSPGPTATVGRVLRVGKGRPIETIAEAARLARDGDTVEIDAGDYFADTATWPQQILTIRGANGRPRLIANGASAEGKGIWVIRGKDVTVENIEFRGARVSDRNGAGIRVEADRLVIRNCRFEDNENGIMGGKAETVLEIYNSEFVNNGAGDGYSHNLYVGGRRVIMQGSYSARARVGHLFKSRATETYVLYNRLTGEDGTSSYELEFPIGGLAVVVGNLIEQGPKSENAAIVAYGAESYRWPVNTLYLSHNTIVNNRPQGATFVSAKKGNASIVAVNNISVGKGNWRADVPAELRGNVAVDKRDFASPERFDYRLRIDAPVIGRAAAIDPIGDVDLHPKNEYVHPARTKPLRVFGAPPSPGAFQTIGP